MRVAYLLPDPGIPVGGTKGASIHVAEVTRALVEARATVLLLAMRATGDPPNGVELAPYDCGPIPSGAPGELLRMRAVDRFLAWAELEAAAFHPDLVYERLSLFAGGGGELASRLGVGRLLEVNAPVAAERARHFGLKSLELAEIDERRALAGASVCAVTEPMKDWSLSLGASSAEVIPNGVDADRFDPARNASAAAALRRGLGLEGAEVVGFVGSLKPWHGVEVLLDAVTQLAQRRHNLHLLLVGDGPGRAHLEAQIRRGSLGERCQLTGAVPSSKIPDYLAALDIATAPYLHPGLVEGFYFSPLKVVEAMAAARPVVASRFDSIESLLGGTGSLVEPGSASELAAALEHLLDHPEVSRMLGAKARTRAVTSYSWSRVADRILAAAGQRRFAAARDPNIAPVGAP